MSKRTRAVRIATATTLVRAAAVDAMVTVNTGPPAFAARHGVDRPAADADRLQVAVDDLHNLGITGVQGFTRVGNRTTTARSGVAKIDSRTPVPTNGYLRIGGETKAFVSVTLLPLVGEKRLSLEDPVERWLPGVVSGNGNDGIQITVRQLLQHANGIADCLDYVELQKSAGTSYQIPARSGCWKIFTGPFEGLNTDVILSSKGTLLWARSIQSCRRDTHSSRAAPCS